MLNLRAAITVVTGQQQEFMYLRSIIANECPVTLSAIRLMDHEYTTVKSPKGYNLVKRESKKLGYVYYVRYWHDGRMLSSKWCTHTNNYDKAREFAEENREKLITGYFSRNGGEVARFFSKFYNLSSSVYQSECRRSNELTESIRKRYLSIMKNEFAPFLRERRIKSFDEITVPLLDDFQDVLLAKGIKSQSANDQMGALSRIFKYLTRKGKIKDNPYLKLERIQVKPEEKRSRGCYELDTMKGIFEKRWKDKTSYLLNLINYSTDMRNCEMRSFSKADIVNISGCKFIDLKESKTENGIRLVPLHDKVYKKILDYSKTLNRDIPIFGDIADHVFKKASRELGRMLRVSEDFRKEQNITFYSGRHFWKTLMSREGLGEDAEEIFMGHKVSNDVARIYNHRDKQGKKLIVKKARQVFAILDKCVFTK